MNRLEGETLPKYFRHNRFQSLVRQLNFYSFRKINKERNVWIYKHKLFHRDHPETLHLVRRRTCPGVDGRKQRFSRVSARKLSKGEEEPNSSDDDSSIDETPSTTMVSQKNRTVTPDENASAKRAGRIWNTKGTESMVVDATIVRAPAASPTSVFLPETLVPEADAPDDSSARKMKKNDRMELVEQSMVVSEVASKLEEYARKALGGSLGRTRRAGSGFGIVTPPYGASGSAPISTNGLITYDDEYEYKRDGMISDGEDSLAGEDGRFVTKKVSSPKPLKELLAAPVEDPAAVQEVSDRIMNSGVQHDLGANLASAFVARFCMSNAPASQDQSLNDKILELISGCEDLALEFQQYRAALDPDQAIPIKQLWEHSSSRRGAVQDFKTFAVNRIHKLLGYNSQHGYVMPFSHDQVANLKYTADLWSKSVAF